MPKPLGGRGIKAPYQTTTVRIPVDIKPQVDDIVERFREGDLETTKSDSNDDKISQIQETIARYREVAKNSRDWTKANQLILELAAILGEK